MRAFASWLSNDEGLSEFPCQFPLILLAILLAVSAGAFVAENVFPAAMVMHEQVVLEEMSKHLSPGAFLLRTLVLSPIVEELIFRLLLLGVPLFLHRWFAQRNMTPGYTASLVFATAVLFGYVHGTSANILMQGVAGVGLALVFIKWSGFGRNIFAGVFASTLVHGAYNGVLESHDLLVWIRSLVVSFPN